VFLEFAISTNFKKGTVQSFLKKLGQCIFWTGQVRVGPLKLLRLENIHPGEPLNLYTSVNKL